MSGPQELLDKHRQAIASALPHVPMELVQLIARFSFLLVDVALALQQASLEAEHQPETKYRAICQELERSMEILPNALGPCVVRIAKDCETYILDRLAANGLHGYRCVELTKSDSTAFSICVHCKATYIRCICERAAGTAVDSSFRDRLLNMRKATVQREVWKQFKNDIGQKRKTHMFIGWVPDDLREEIVQEYKLTGLYVYKDTLRLTCTLRGGCRNKKARK